MALPSVPIDRVNKPSTTTPIGATFFNAILAWMRAVTTGGAGSGLDADTVTGKKVWLTSSATAGDDGNGGQPPAPKPAASPAGGAESQGQHHAISTGSSYTIPAGTSWWYHIIAFDAAGAFVAANSGDGFAVGGASFSAPSGGSIKGFVIRVV